LFLFVQTSSTAFIQFLQVRSSDIWVFRSRGSAVVHATAQYFRCASSMGCCASKGAPEFTFGKKAEPPASAPHINLKQRRRNSVHQLTSNEKVAVQTIWDTYRTSIRMSSGQATSDDDDGTAEYEMKNKKKVMKKDGLRKILPEIDEAFFNYLWRLFDTQGRGEVDADEFVMAMALLSSGIADSTDAQLEAAFCMFDSNHSGVSVCPSASACSRMTHNSPPRPSPPSASRSHPPYTRISHMHAHSHAPRPSHVVAGADPGRV
jgi:hypothetical protein